MRTTLLLIAAILVTPNLHAQAKNPKRKPNPVFAAVKDDPKLPRVVDLSFCGVTDAHADALLAARATNPPSPSTPSTRPA